MIVGFMAQNTLGRRIKEEQPVVKILGDTYRLRAEVVTMNAFSAHADYKEILDYVTQLDYKRLKRIFLVHGEPDAQANLKKLLEEQNYKTTIVKYGERYTLQV
jgi:metallo-beta-lactamase family protein